MPAQGSRERRAVQRAIADAQQGYPTK